MKNKLDLDSIYGRPGFLLRRCHQISVAVFLEECERFDLTPAQFGMLTVLDSSSDIDQISLAQMLGLDRTTTSNVVSRLEARGIIKRVTDPMDRRKRRLQLTVKGRKIRKDAVSPAARAGERLLAGLSAKEQKLFLDLLQLVADTADGLPRAALVRYS